jgi:hypothetical protein
MRVQAGLSEISCRFLINTKPTVIELRIIKVKGYRAVIIDIWLRAKILMSCFSPLRPKVVEDLLFASFEECKHRDQETNQRCEYSRPSPRPRMSHNLSCRPNPGQNRPYQPGDSVGFGAPIDNPSKVWDVADDGNPGREQAQRIFVIQSQS